MGITSPVIEQDGQSDWQSEMKMPWEKDEIWQLSHGRITATHMWEDTRLVCRYCGMTMKEIQETHIVLCRKVPKECEDEQRS